MYHRTRMTPSVQISWSVVSCKFSVDTASNFPLRRVTSVSERFMTLGEVAEPVHKTVAESEWSDC